MEKRHITQSYRFIRAKIIIIIIWPGGSLKGKPKIHERRSMARAWSKLVARPGSWPTQVRENCRLRSFVSLMHACVCVHATKHTWTCA